MKLRVRPGNSLRGEVKIPGDKSISHRAALFAAMASGESCIKNLLIAGVTRVMLNALTQVGVKFEICKDTLYVSSLGMENWPSEIDMIDCGNSATTMRLLTGALAAANISTSLDGSESLRLRPMDRITEPLKRMGVNISAHNGFAPLKLEKSSHPLLGIDYKMKVSSAQVKSCILLAGLSAREPTTIEESVLSRDHTERMLSSMGAIIESKRIKTDQNDYYQTVLFPSISIQLKPLHTQIPGDFSAAAFLLIAALITPGSELLIKEIGLNPTRTGLLDVLIKMGADIQIKEISCQAGEPVGDILVRYSSLSGTSIFGSVVVRMIDEFPALAIAAAFANRRTIVSQAEELRYKESDRIASICACLSKLGVRTILKEDGFIIYGGNSVRGGTINSYKDHRIAMAMAICGLASKSEMIIEDAEIIEETYPEFISTFRELGSDMELER